VIEQLAAKGQPQVFLTGGAGPAVARLLGRSSRYVPHLTLAGIALATGGQG
jgi:pantothenate kinase type III